MHLSLYSLLCLGRNDKISDGLNKFLDFIGAHNVGKISCDFIRDRLTNFSGTGQPDASVDPNFLNELRLACQDSSSTDHDGTVASMTSREMGNSSSAMIFQGLSSSVPSGARFDNHYYQNLLKGREDFYL